MPAPMVNFQHTIGISRWERSVAFPKVALRAIGVLGLPVLGMLGADFGGGVEVTNAAAPTSYSLTIYVDEGHSDVVGHVFVELSDGKNVLYRGFHPEQARTDTFGRVIAPLGLGGGEVQDDRGHHWDVRRSYNISRDGYRDALQFVEQVRKQHAAWCLTNHCGEFALAVANAAGIHLGLPLNSALEDRPG